MAVNLDDATRYASKVAHTLHKKWKQCGDLEDFVAVAQACAWRLHQHVPKLSWLGTCVQNEITDKFIRKYHTKRRTHTREYVHGDYAYTTDKESVEHRDFWDWAMKQITTQEREVLQQRFVNKLTYENIGQNSQRHMYSALKKIRKSYEKGC